MKELAIFTSESVTAGHPDKLSDQVSDAIVDHFLARDPLSTVDAECALASGILFISAQYASTANLDLAAIARNVIAGAGYPKAVFDADLFILIDLDIEILVLKKITTLFQLVSSDMSFVKQRFVHVKFTQKIIQ